MSAAPLWLRHPRARFAAYIFFTVLAARGLIRGQWLAVLFAVAAVLVMQTAPARRAWPRLRRSSAAMDGDRMATP